MTIDIFNPNRDKVADSIAILQKYEELHEGEGYYVAFSGGKDSMVIAELCKLAGVKFDLNYNITGIDPPEVIHFMRKHYPQVIHHRPPNGTFLKQLIRKEFPPIRTQRWCCVELKEHGGVGRVTVTGVRRHESYTRSKRQLLSGDTTKTTLNPILEWTDYDVWTFIRSRNLPYCDLYNQGFTRIGCMYCPFSTAQEKAMYTQKYPKIYKAFERTFVKVFESRKLKGKKNNHNWANGEEMFRWWLIPKPAKQDKTSMSLFE